MRRDPAFRTGIEERPPCAARTHAKAVKRGREAEGYQGFKKDHPSKLYGIKRLSPLVYFPLFDIIWDILPDLMHIIEGLQKTHILPLLKRKRKPKVPKPLKKRKVQTPKDAQKREAAFKKVQATHAKVVAHVHTWELSDKNLKIVDTRSQLMGGQKSWIRSNANINQRTGSLNAHDWVKLIESSYERYILKGLLLPNQLEALEGVHDAIRACMRATGENEDDEFAKDQIRALKVMVVRALCVWTREVPRTEWASVLHILGHVPDAVYRWGSGRNYWAFFGERYINCMSTCRC